MILSALTVAPHLIPSSLKTAPQSHHTNQPAVASAHLVGACGTGMKALSELLLDLGWQVTGSDCQAASPVTQAMLHRGLRVHHGHQSENLPDDADVLVYSPAVSAENPERQRAAELGIDQLTYSQMLGRLMQNRTGVCIAGTHGKSTTTAMVSTIFHEAGLAPSAVMGAEMVPGPHPLAGRNGFAGSGDLFVAESCEYQRSFLDLTPEVAVILGIEPDHFDYYQSLKETEAAFAEFARKVPATGMILRSAECASSARAVNETDAKVLTFSTSTEADWWATDLRRTPEGNRFRVFSNGQFFSEILLRTPGHHNVSNALAAIAVCDHLGVSSREIRDILADFAGIRRRFEQIGSWRGVTLIDDYAHHPTAVKATLRAAREKFGSRRLWCAFQPHQVSRTQTLLNDFAESFSDADEVLLVPVYAARESQGDEPQRLSVELTERVNNSRSSLDSTANPGKPSARYCPELDQIVTTLEEEARPGDVLLTLGAGDINRVHYEFTRRLQRHHPPR